MIYGYARVSSVSQAKDGNSLENQELSLRQKGCEIIYKEAYTGTTMERPEFSKIFSKIQKGDTLVVTKLDRLSRTATEGVEVINKLLDMGVVVDIINMGKADNTPMGKLMVTMLLAFAEFEHDNIVERLQSGKQVAKAHGKKTDGRYEKKPSDFNKYLKMQKDGMITVLEACQILDIGKTTWYKLVKEYGALSQN